MHPHQRSRRFELPSPISIGDETFVLFRRDGTPIGDNFRKATEKIEMMEVVSEAEEAFRQVADAMEPNNAVRIYRNLCSVTHDTWMGALLSAKLYDLGFVFAEAAYHPGRREMTATIPGRRKDEKITYVSPRGRRGEVEHGERVIVPQHPRGRRLREDVRRRTEVYVQVLYPARPWRRKPHETP